MRVRLVTTILLGAGFAMTGCSSETEAYEMQPVETEDSTRTAADASDPVAEPEDEFGWEGLDDPEVQAAIAARVDAFARRTGYRYGFLAVDRLADEDRFGAAGMAAWDLGTPAIVASIEQRDVQIVGDEALAYMEDTRNRIAGETADYFNRGEFEAGVNHALEQIEASWSSEG